MARNRSPHAEPLTRRIERRLAEEAGIYAAVEERGQTIVLTGPVDSPEARQAAEDIVRALAPERPIDNSLDVTATEPVSVADMRSDQPAATDLPEDVAELEAEGGELEEDFTDQPLATSSVDPLDGMLSTQDPIDESEDEPSAFAPTDPVIGQDAWNRTVVLGGFSATSMDDTEPQPSALDNEPGDEALADAIRRELQEDALTTDLVIEVTVRDGVAHLRGAVPTLEDAEAAEEVAGRVRGVVEVSEDLEITSM